jgi:predicted component of type VI protein secretion system
MVAEVWLIDEASGPVQLHRSAIVTVLDELAALAAAGMIATLATASAAVANADIFARTITCTPFAPRY